MVHVLYLNFIVLIINGFRGIHFFFFRSESFANDAQILDKLNKIKLGLPDSSGLNGRVVPIAESRGEFDKVHASKPTSSR